jgi:excisionase family DNA binding protein
MTEGSALMDARRLAGLLGMSRSSVYALSASGAIPAYKCGKKLRGRRFDLGEVREALRLSVKSDGK